MKPLRIHDYVNYKSIKITMTNNKMWLLYSHQLLLLLGGWGGGKRPSGEPRDKMEQGKCLWALGVCQSRNWEAVLGWPQRARTSQRVPLQNNSRPSSWQQDTGGCCSARTALKPHRDPPNLSSSSSSPIQEKPPESGSGRMHAHQT